MAGKKTSRSRAKSPKTLAARATASPVTVVNMIPKTLSQEAHQDSEPMIAVDPANPKRIVAQRPIFFRATSTSA